MGHEMKKVHRLCKILIKQKLLSKLCKLKGICSQSEAEFFASLRLKALTFLRLFIKSFYMENISL
jgi:hypothetical protein